MPLMQAVIAFPLQCRNLQTFITGYILPSTDTKSGLQTYALIQKKKPKEKQGQGLEKAAYAAGRTENGLGYL